MLKNTKNVEELYREFNSGPDGLPQAAIRNRLLKEGLNTIGTKDHWRMPRKALEQFSDFLVIMLIIASLLSFFLGDTRTAIIMLIIVSINAVIGFWQQYKVEKTLSALRKLLPHHTQVIRDGRERDILSIHIVPGDVILLQAGDSIPCDGKIIEAYTFKTNEAALTGESNAQLKHERSSLKHPYADMVFMGTTVMEGEARILAVRTGKNTEFGRIAVEAKKTKDDLSPLQKKLRDMGKTVAKIAGSIMIGIVAYELIQTGVISRQPIEISFLRDIFIFALALSAALVPEGLPATVSVALSLGANRLIKKRAIVKKLSSVETLGSTNVICTDKTGTLTTGKMAVVSMLTPQEELINLPDIKIDAHDKILKNWILCNNARKSDKGVVGDADEVALFEAAERLKAPIRTINEVNKRIHEISFNPIRKMMSVIVKDGDKAVLYSKGNPHIILSKCNMNEVKQKRLLRQMDAMADQGFRVLAFAHKSFTVPPTNFHAARIEDELIFDGFCGIEDAIRPEVPRAIEYCHRAGIKVVMITGDYKVTAHSVAKKIKLSPNDFRMISGSELKVMSDLALRENLLHPVVFYETDPGEKLRIVDNLQKMGQVVAVTGDGVNDALALKKADIGVAMGQCGTDVAKESADMVLMDDNFATIVNAVKEGRIIWDNLKKFLYYILSSNAGEFMTVFIGTLLGLPLPLLAVQVLSVDLGTDVFPSLALVADPAEKNILKRPVINHENLLGKSTLLRLLYVGVVMGGGAAINFWLVNGHSIVGSDQYYKATTAAFATLVVCQIVNVFEVRGGFSDIKETFFSNKLIALSVLAEAVILICVVYSPPIQNMISTRSLSLLDWLPIFSAGLVFLATEEILRNYTIKNSMVTLKSSPVE